MCNYGILYKKGQKRAKIGFISIAHPSSVEMLSRSCFCGPVALLGQPRLRSMSWRERPRGESGRMRAGLVVVLLGWTHAGGTAGDKRGIGNQIVEQVSGGVGCWNPVRWKSAQTYARFWRQAAPALRASLSDDGCEPDRRFADSAIVHFRCSDVPFWRHEEYPLLPRSYFEFARDAIARLGARRTIVLSCPTVHRDKGHRDKAAAVKCPEWAAVIAGWLNATERPVCIADERAVCAAMRGAKALVSTGGSFSFIHGVARGDATFVAPTLVGVGDYEAASELAAAAHWTVHAAHERITHGCVPNYAHFDLAATPAHGCVAASDAEITPTGHYGAGHRGACDVNATSAPCWGGASRDACREGEKLTAARPMALPSKGAAPEQCESLCSKTPGCRAWTFVAPDDSRCYLYGNSTTLSVSTEAGYTSGVVRAVGGIETPAGRRQPGAPRRRSSSMRRPFRTRR